MTEWRLQHSRATFGEGEIVLTALGNHVPLEFVPNDYGPEEQVKTQYALTLITLLALTAGFGLTDVAAWIRHRRPVHLGSNSPRS